MSDARELSPERVLILTPTGQDAQILEARLVAAGFACQICRDLDALLSSLPNDVGAALIAQEALSPSGAETLLATLDAQAPWSDVPVLLLTLASKHLRNTRPHAGLLERANVMLLQRPMPQHLLLSAVRSAVRARRRQYEVRNLHNDLARAVQLSDMFVGILGHDLRTPLAAIKMSAHVIAQAGTDTRSLAPAGRILNSADRMARMIEQLLDFARVRQGQGIRLQPVSTDLGELTRQVLREFTDTSQHARIEVSLLGDLHGHWDPDRLGQVVSNLVGNAIQHGAAAQSVIVELDGTEQTTALLRVGNVGTISQESIPTLFEPFRRATDASRGETGLGLGLFIAREIVRAHAGEIAVRVVDETVVFEVTLPRETRSVETDMVRASGGSPRA